jgi:Bifunctional DNA primase/polymerase, N-terminal
MFIYTTCLDCGGSLLVTNNDTSHPLCDPKPTKVERLTEDWLNAIELGHDERAVDLQAQIDEIDSRPPRLLDAALIYAKWGWPVFPLKPLSLALKAPNPVKEAKRPNTANGFKDASTDPDQIRAWWQRHPDSNIGLATGHAFDVIDIDTYAGGVPTYLELHQQDLPIHGHATTAQGGIHLYIQPTGRGCLTRWKPGSDYRGQGGYVVAPPSWIGAHDRAWSWQHRPSPVITGVGDTYATR